MCFLFFTSLAYIRIFGRNHADKRIRIHGIMASGTQTDPECFLFSGLKLLMRLHGRAVIGFYAGYALYDILSKRADVWTCVFRGTLLSLHNKEMKS